MGRIYEYFLNKFAKNIAQDDGVFFTPKSLVKRIANIIEPRRGSPGQKTSVFDTGKRKRKLLESP